MNQQRILWGCAIVFVIVVTFGAITTTFTDLSTPRKVADKKTGATPSVRSKVLETFSPGISGELQEDELITVCCNQSCSVSVEVHKISQNGTTRYEVNKEDVSSEEQLTLFQWFANYLNLQPNKTDSMKSMNAQCQDMVEKLQQEEEEREMKGEEEVDDFIQEISGNNSEEYEFMPVKIHEVLEKLTTSTVEYHPDHRKVPVWLVLLMTTLMAACAGIGALPYFCIKTLSEFWSGISNSVACGVMLAAGFDLIKEGQPYGAVHVIIGIVCGTVFVHWLHQFLHKYEDVKFEHLKGVNARKLLVFVSIMAAHAIGEGAGVGVSFSGRRGWTQGLIVTLAIGIHNIPEGLATATVLIGRGCKPRQALMWTLLTAAPQPLFAVPAFIFVESFKACLPIAMGFAAGCMMWIVFSELLPEALEKCEHSVVASVTCIAAAWLEGLGMLLNAVENPNNTLSVPNW
eukprot:TRINITY_DN5001_c0_g2_i4.p1 TRINITY_DN5001_c0_g2~~TRINITY_DN5001_c0_g2_i4.p1  ORF type:complete len:481 (-),score=70.70 TRINITY_DN5001_c0_g2_i4:3253-4626(-)